MYSLENEILSLQADSGAFHSKAQMSKGEHDDWNGLRHCQKLIPNLMIVRVSRGTVEF
jgi:hypothetical protein